MSSVRNQNQDLTKQIGCINGFFQLFDRRHFIATTTDAQRQKDQAKTRKEKSRDSIESSRASCSSSCSSSTFSSLDCNRTTRPETTVQIKGRQSSLHKNRSSSNTKERRDNVMKHIDSPRPKATGRIDAKVAFHRFSYDGRESRETVKWKELPRLSLDSKTSSPRFGYLGSSQGQEPPSHQRSSSLVAKLMGLETFPDVTTSYDTPRSRVSQSNPASPYRKASVYGEIGKRIKELEFKKSSKDLRALKQILEAMEKTNEQQSRISSEDSCSSQSSNLISEGATTPVAVKRNSRPRQLGASAQSKMSQLKQPQIKEPKLRPKNRTNLRGLEPNRPRRIVVENYASPGRSSTMVSPRSQQNLLRVRVSQSRETGSPNRKHKGNTESGTPPARKHIRGRAIETAVTVVEQPSPISVLDDTFYSEDSPSPVKKTSNAFHDESSSLEWNFEDQKYLTECRRSVQGFDYNQTLSSMKHSIQELSFLRNQANDEVKLNKKIQRKIIFDMVDEILIRKIKSMGKKRTNAQGLLKEIHLEMDRTCRISDGFLDNIEDEMTRLLTADIMYQSDDWQEHNGELPVLVLDIERQIFKELINEVVIGEVMNHRDKPKNHCRQLF